MRDTIFAKCDSEFVVAAIRKNKRLDGRRFDELRSIELHFGSDFGCAYVTLGETKVIAQISCELSEPRNVRKNEGNLFVNVEIHDMVCGVFETGHHAHLGVHTNRLIEKCIKDSRCVDLEALCIISEEQAWEIRVDVSVLNYDGNLVTCCSLAALAALAHFKTPHVTIENSEIRIDSIKEHEPEPLSLHHYPLLIAFGIFGENDDVLLDPTELEEKVCESEMVIGMNSFGELCGMHFSGRTTSNRLLIVNASRQAALVANDLVKLLKAKLEIDNEERKKNRGKSEGLVSAIHTDRVLSASQDRSTLRVTQREIEETACTLLQGQQKMKVSDAESDDETEPENMDTEEMRPVFRKDLKKGVEVPPMSSFGSDWAPSGKQNAWTLPNATLSDVDSEDDEDDVGFVKIITDEDRIIDRIELNDSEEEQDTIILEPKAPQRPLATGTHVSSSADDNAVSQGPCPAPSWLDDEDGRALIDSSSYSMTSPSFSSNTSISTSLESDDSCKPNYNPPKPGQNEPTSDSLKYKKRNQFVFSPSSPSSSSSDNLRPNSSKIVFPSAVQHPNVQRYKRYREPLEYAKVKRKRRLTSTERSRFRENSTNNFPRMTPDSEHPNCEPRSPYPSSNLLSNYPRDSWVHHLPCTSDQPCTSQTAHPSKCVSIRDNSLTDPLDSVLARNRSAEHEKKLASSHSADSSLESLHQKPEYHFPSSSQHSKSNAHSKSTQRPKQRHRKTFRRHLPLGNNSSTSSSRLDRSSSPTARKSNCSSPVPIEPTEPAVVRSDSSTPNFPRTAKLYRFSPTHGISDAGAPSRSCSNSNNSTPSCSSDEANGYKRWAKKVKRRISTCSSSQSSRYTERVPKPENQEEVKFAPKTFPALFSIHTRTSDVDSTIPSPKYSPSSDPFAYTEILPPYSPSSPSTSIGFSSIPNSTKQPAADRRIKTEALGEASDQQSNVLPSGSRLPPYTLEWLMGSSSAALRDTQKSHLSDSVFSPSGSPELPDFSPSSPSHHPPSPAFSPSSPSYSSGSCTSPEESPAPQNSVGNGDIVDGNGSSDDLLSPTYSPTSPKYSSASTSPLENPSNPQETQLGVLASQSDPLHSPPPESVSPTSPNYSSGPSSPLNGSYGLPQERTNGNSCSSSSTHQKLELAQLGVAESLTSSIATPGGVINAASQEMPGSSVVSRSPEIPRYSPSSPSHQPPSLTLSPTSPQYSSDANSTEMDRSPSRTAQSCERDVSRHSSSSSSPTSPKYSSGSCDSPRLYDQLEFGSDAPMSPSHEQPIYSPSSPSVQQPSPSCTNLLPSDTTGSSCSNDGFSTRQSPQITDSVSLVQSVASSMMSQAMSPAIPLFSPSSPSSSSDSLLSPISSPGWTSASERPTLSRSSRSSSTSTPGTTLILKVVIPKP